MACGALFWQALSGALFCTPTQVLLRFYLSFRLACFLDLFTGSGGGYGLFSLPICYLICMRFALDMRPNFSTSMTSIRSSDAEPRRPAVVLFGRQDNPP